MSDLLNIGQNIVTLRKQKKFSQERLALESDMSVAHLRAIEHGRGNPTINTLLKIATTLNEPLSSLILPPE